MTNFKGPELNLHELPEDTRYRFAEIELNQALKTLHNLFVFTPNPRLETAKFLFERIDPKANDQEASDFYDLLVSYLFVNPTKEELIAYFRYNGVTYGKITKATGISPNTIAANRFNEPYYYAIYRHWNPEMLSNWNLLKTTFNLWEEKLFHS